MAAKKRVKLTNVNHIRKLFLTASDNNKAEATRKRARTELTNILERERKTANSRLKALESKDYDYGNAYDNARSYIEREQGENARAFYKPKKNATLDEIYDEALAVNAFLANPQSKVSTQKAIENKRFETYRNMIFSDGSSPFATMTDDDLRGFLRFLGNESAGDYLSFYDESGDDLEQMALIWQDESKRDKLRDLMKEYETYTKQIDAGVEPKDAGGLSVTDLRKELFKLYASHTKRTR